MAWTQTIRLGGAVAAIVLALSPGLADDGAVRFVTPRHLSTVIGPAKIEFHPRVPAGLELVRVELIVNGKLLTTLTGPPWTADWDAGDGTRGNRIEAVLYLSDGSTARGLVRTSPLRINQVEEVGLVNLYAVVRRSNGDYATELDADDFLILENGVAQEVKRFSTRRKPLRVGIAMDTSQSMTLSDGKKRKKLQQAQEAALEFLDILEAGDEGLVVTFNDRVEVVQGLTQSRDELANAISSVESRGGTALYDALWRTASKLEDFDGRRVLVLLSDGKDESYTGLEPGSLHTLNEALVQALKSEVIVYTIGLGKRLESEYAIPPGMARSGERVTVAEVLRRIADATGGRALISARASELRKAFDDVAEDLHHQYSIAYVPTDESRDGAWREIKVKIAGRKGLEVITRKGYYASGPR